MCSCRILSFAVGLGLLGACAKEPGPAADETGGNTSWLASCERDADCAGQQCLQGVCTTACESDAQCAAHGDGASCTSAQGECGAICLPACSSDAECSRYAELSCTEGTCAPSACARADSDSTDSSLGTSDSEGDAATEPGDAEAPISELMGSVPRAPAQGAADNSAAQDEREFTWNLYRQRNAPEENSILSPYSVSTAFAMLAAGAGGDTLTEIAEALRYSTQGDAFHAAQNTLLQVLASRNHEATEMRHSQVLRVVNDLWLERTFEVKSAFVDTLGQYYGVGVGLTSFATQPDASRSAINAKVSDATDALIPELIPPDGIDASTRLVLTNAIFLEAHWADIFDEENTVNMPFAGVLQAVEVPMMRRTAQYVDYFESDEVQAIALPFEGYELEFVAILPKEDFAAFVRDFDATLAAQISSATQTATVDLGLPRFEVQSNLELASDLKTLGMQRAFDALSADFSPIADEPIYVKYVFHDAHMLVEEDGVQAAGATAIVAGPGAGLPAIDATMILDRPFVFLIRDVESGAILFVGHYSQPAVE